MGTTSMGNTSAQQIDQDVTSVSFLQRALLTVMRENITLHVEIRTLRRDRNTPKLTRGRSVLATCPLLVAAKTNDTETLSELLLHGADANTSGENGATAVYVAAEQNNVAALQILLERGADPNIALSGGCGFTPVYVASLRNHKKALTVLLRAGADPNVPICGMLRAMDIAARSDNTAAAAVLHEYGAQTYRCCAAASGLTSPTPHQVHVISV